MPRSSVALALLVVAACGSNSTPSDVLGGSLTVSGSVYDLRTDVVVDGTASVTATNLLPQPRVTVDGASFELADVPENSAFQILASVDPTHRATYSATVEITDSDVDAVKAYAVSEALLAELSTTFGISPAATNGTLFVQLIDGAGAPKAGVAGGNIVLGGVSGVTVRFLDATLAGAPQATASTSSGWAVLFDVPPGIVNVAPAANATATLAMPSAIIGAGQVTLARATVTDGPPSMLPTNVSFSQQVFPIFDKRGCVACHSGGGPGKDLGGLMLDSGVQNVYRELTVENALRVQPAMPERSLLLTYPSSEIPPDGHPNVTFAGPQDPDYVKILVWIREGAKNN